MRVVQNCLQLRQGRGASKYGTNDLAGVLRRCGRHGVISGRGVPCLIPSQGGRHAERDRDGDHGCGDRRRTNPKASCSIYAARIRRARRVGRRIEANGALRLFDALSQSIESGHRHLLDGRIGRHHVIDSPLGPALVATGAAQAQVRLDALAVAFAQPSIDEPRKQLPNIVVFGGRVSCIHKEGESLKMSVAAIPPRAGRCWRSFSRAWNMRAFTVPGGQPVIFAISSIEWPM